MSGTDSAGGRVRQIQGARVAWLSVALNVILTVGKGSVGWLAGSRALVADAVHSAADLVGSLAVTIGLRVARKPPDQDHPYGHGKAELLSSALVACLLVIAAIDIGYRSIVALWQVPPPPRWGSAVVALASLVLKEAMYRYSYRLGKRLHSRSLLATAVDHRTDVYASLAALVGIMLAILGHRIGVSWLLHADAAAAVIVAVMVLKMGYDILRDSIELLMDRVLADKDVAPFRRAVAQVPGVLRIDQLLVRDHGQYLLVDVKIRVDGEISVRAGHAVASAVKHQLLDLDSRVLDVLVHVNPYIVEAMQQAEEGSRERRTLEDR